MRPWILLPLALACKSDNELHGKVEPEKPGEDTAVDTAPPEDLTCEGVTLDTTPRIGVTVPEDCQTRETTPDWTLTYKWSDTSTSTMLSTVAVGNLTDDNGNGVIDDGDSPDVVATPYGYSIIAYDGETGTRLWTASTSNIEQGTPSIGDLDGDGFPEVVVGGLYSSVAVHGHDGSAYWTGSGSESIKMYCGASVIADLNADGDPEVIIGRQIMNGQTGALLARGSYGFGTSISGESPQSLVADIDLDGDQEVVVGNSAYAMDGSSLYYTGTSDGFPGVANFDDDDEAEIISVTSGTVYLFDTDGTVIWTSSIGGGGYYGPPAIADFDGDGAPEIAVPIAPGVVMLDTDGTLMWTFNGTSATFFDGVSAYDLDGDNDWEVLHVGSGGLNLLDGATGTQLSTLAAATSYCGQMPVVADLDNDEHVEMAFGTYSAGVFVMEDATDNFTAGLNYWNQHAFSITNVTSTGDVPTNPDPNWTSGYNSFRAGPPVGTVAPAVNVVGRIIDVCTDECDAGSIYVSWSIGNTGGTDIEDEILVEIYGTTDRGDVPLWSTTWTTGLEAGAIQPSVLTTITGVRMPIYDLYIQVDGVDTSATGAILECDEEDNTYTYSIDCVE